jgi:hypothetical protein
MVGAFFVSADDQPHRRVRPFWPSEIRGLIGCKLDRDHVGVVGLQIPCDRGGLGLHYWWAAR